MEQDTKDARRKRDSFAARGAADAVATYGDEALPLPEASASPSDAHGVALDPVSADEKALSEGALSEAQICKLYTRGLINHATWANALRASRGDPRGQHAVRTCEVAVEELVERAIDAACATIQEKLGVKTGDRAAAVLSDGTLERELTRYVHAELAAVAAGSGETP